MEGSMQAFALGPANVGGQKNYVFVDEHNRHKRLKVMRACGGCRRRKIKCDAATTNTWPCSACTRLKLQCDPPTLGQDRDFTGIGYGEYETMSTPTAMTQAPQEFSGQNMPPQHYYPQMPVLQTSNPNAGFVDGNGPYQVVPYPPRIQTQQNVYSHITSVTGAMADGNYSQHQSAYYTPTHQQPLLNGTPTSPDGDKSAAEGLSEALGELKIDDVGIAPFMRKQNKLVSEPEGPVEDGEVKLPVMSTAAGTQIRIPPELMPLEEDALHYFEVFFRDIHPYVPVINRQHFYHQWAHDRNSLSPLLLESLFACAGRLSGEPAEGAQWLALAARHEASFLDTPRLSTLQALCLLLKARESVPRRGYYYKSWMTCKTLVSMAKDLDLHEHYETHEAGESCGATAVECLTKTRVWQTIFICEMMVGAPQGRSDMGVDPDTVEIRSDPRGSELNDFETNTSRHFACFVRNVRNIRRAVTAYHTLKRNKDWQTDPRFVKHNTAFNDWPKELPSDFQIALPADGGAPWLPSHFVANIHIYYHLGVVMMQRSQLQACPSFVDDGMWKQRMRLSYNSAKIISRLQEAVLERYGLDGLMCMQRGMSFTIYVVLTCTMLHLVAITCPDPEFNVDAREYFTRHMRILEHTIPAWPMPEMQAQVEALRVAFSADTKKPFELRPSFPYGSPSEPNQSSPPLEYQMRMPQDQPRPIAPYVTPTITPPISAGPRDESPHMSQRVGMLHPQNHITSNMTPVTAVSPADWNPSRIFDQFDSAFAIPQSALAPPSSATSQSPPSALPIHQGSHSVPSNTQADYVQSYTPSGMPQSSATHAVSPSSYHGGAPVYFSARDWQQSVASVYDPDGLKRRWSSNPDDMMGQMQKRIR